MWKRVVGKSPIARVAASSRGPIAALTLALFLGTSGSLLFVFAPWNAVAGTPAEGEYQSYPLRHVDVGKVRSHIEQLLANSATQAEIVVDMPRNAILIRGNEQVHRLVRELIREVDRLSTQPSGQRIDGEGQVRVYDFHGNDLERFMVDLRNRYAGRGDVRVSADGKSHQVVVFASPQEHAGLERDMGTLLHAVASTPASGGAVLNNIQTGTGSDTTATRFIELRHLSIPQFENTLAGMFGARLAKEGQVAGGLRGYQLSIASGDRVTIGINDRFNQLSLQGSESLVAALARVIAILDRPGDPTGQAVQIVPLRRADPEKLREAFRAYRGDATGLAAPRGNPGTGENRAEAPAKEHGAQTHFNPTVQAADFDPVDTRGDIQLASMLLQEDAGANAGGGTDSNANTNGAADEKAPEAVDAQQPADGGLDSETAKRLRGLRDNVEIEMLPELDVVILRGSDQDVRELVDIIQEIERISEQSVPRIEVVELHHVSSDALGRVITQVEAVISAGRQGQVIVRSLSKPNAMLVIGWGETMDAMLDLIGRLDQPTDPESQLQIFRLKHAPAATAQQTIAQFFTNRQGLGPNVVVAADARSNALIVQASPRDMQEVALLVERLDTPGSDVVNQLRTIPLKNALAADVGPILQQAITAVGTGTQGASGKSILEILTLDAAGRKLVESGMLSGVRITPDPNTNTLIISAPADSMELVAALVQQLDSLPSSSMAQIKVFRILNGDARSLVVMLQVLLGSQTTGPQLAVAPGEASLAPLRFAVDARSNSIIATGSVGELRIVEAILLRLDESDVKERRAKVYRLRNAPAMDVAVAVNELLRSERVLTQASAGTENVYELLEREVIVVPEPISNSLIISASERFYDRIKELVEELDAQPPQVVIQVLIAEVELGNTREFGVELGIQDSMLFDRSLLGGLVTTTDTTSLSTPAGVVTTTQQNVVAATNEPGFDFNNKPLGNSGSEQSLATAGALAGQALSSFTVGRLNSELGYGGLVLSASSENISVLLRALSDHRRLDILSRPQITTLDNQPAFVQVGERVPYITDVITTTFGQNNAVELVDVGLILAVTPRISPDGTIVMEVDAQKSKLGPREEGIPIFVNLAGKEILSPKIEIIEAQTTVSAADGQTIVLGGLIAETELKHRRRVPYLSDLPILGYLFRYDSDAAVRTELLIVLTPRVVRNENDMERVKQEEAARMSWCLSDVQRVHGNTGIYGTDTCDDGAPEPAVIYPVDNPRGETTDSGVLEGQPTQLLPELYPGQPIEQLPGPGPNQPNEGPVAPDSNLGPAPPMRLPTDHGDSQPLGR